MINVASSNWSCSYCGKSEHIVGICYQKHEYPSSGNGKGKGTQSQQIYNTKICSYCGKNGHIVDDCYKKREYPPVHKFYNNQKATINSTVTSDGNVTEINYVQDKQKLETFHEICFTSQQYEALLALRSQSSNGASASTTPHVNQIGIFPSIVGNILHLTCNINKELSTTWILDSGETNHVS